MNYTEMTDEALALMSADLDAVRRERDWIDTALAGEPEDDRYRAHSPGGIDGRCWDCDARPHTWHRVACI